MKRRKKISGLRIMMNGIFLWSFLFPIFAFFVVMPGCATKSPIKNLEIGKKYSENKNYEKAYKYYTRAIMLNTNYAQAYWERTNLCMLIDSTERTIDDWSMFVERSSNPDSLSTAYFKRGNVMLKAGYKSDACADWEEVIKLNKKEFNQASEKFRLNCK